MVCCWRLPLLRVTTSEVTTWDDLLPDQAKRLPDELARIDAYLDEERFIAPWRAVFSARLGRRSVPVPTLLRLLYLRHRYQLGYQSLCKEVGDSIAWRRFCRIPLDQPVPHPTTLSKLVGRAGPQVIDQLNHALLAKLAAGKLLRARKLRVDTTVVKADIDDPTDADLLEQAVRISAGWCAASRPTASPPPPLPGPLPAGRRLKQLSHTLRRRTGVAIGEVDRLTAQVATIARRAVGEVAAVQHAAHRTLARRPGDGWARRLTGQLDQTVTLTGRLLDQTAQRLAGNRSIPDRVVSLADPDARPIRKGKPRSPTQFGSTLLLAEDERGFIADHLLAKGNPPDAPQLLPAVRRVAELRGRPPGAVVADRGFGFAANDRALAELGVRRIGLQRTGRPSTARRELERTRAFKRLPTWRVGIKATISHLKRSFGMRRTRLRHLAGAQTWAGLGILAYNLQRMTIVAG